MKTLKKIMHIALFSLSSINSYTAYFGCCCGEPPAKKVNPSADARIAVAQATFAQMYPFHVSAGNFPEPRATRRVAPQPHGIIEVLPARSSTDSNGTVIPVYPVIDETSNPSPLTADNLAEANRRDAEQRALAADRAALNSATAALGNTRFSAAFALARTISPVTRTISPREANPDSASTPTIDRPLESYEGFRRSGLHSSAIGGGSGATSNLPSLRRQPSILPDDNIPNAIPDAAPATSASQDAS